MIRSAKPDDLPEIISLIKELADYERAPDEAKATPEDLAVALFGSSPKVFCEIVEVDNEILGFAIWFLNFSTWQGKHGIYLEDLYIRPQYRGLGWGKKLLQHLAAKCVKNDWGRFQWWVLDWNEPAIEFYKSLGATAMDEWTVYRVSEGALDDLGKD
ncbi:MAG: GNAT family N-acetyltransferase [Actinomycetes bacterium]|jgi:GNAT superfamily N-acetyltransferase